MLLEVCAPNYQSAKNAQEANAQRIELCEHLDVGGITPNQELLRKVSNNLSISVFVLIRPRAGNFVYNHAEFEQIKADILTCKELGFDGIVSGILKSDNTIDKKRTKELIELSRPLEFTFHRAFDDVVNPLEALEQLIALGADRILTSGQEFKATEGIELLKILKAEAKGRIQILPGAGINPDNASLFAEAGFKEIHASASKQINRETISDFTTIKAILNAV